MNKNTPSKQMQQLIDNFLLSEMEFFQEAENTETNLEYFIEFNDIKVETHYSQKFSRVDEYAVITEHGEMIATLMINIAR